MQMASRSELFSLLTCIFITFYIITKYLFSVRDDKYKNLGDTTAQACEMFSSSCSLRLKNMRA